MAEKNAICATGIIVLFPDPACAWKGKAHASRKTRAEKGVGGMCFASQRKGGREVRKGDVVD